MFSKHEAGACTLDTFLVCFFFTLQEEYRRSLVVAMVNCLEDMC